MSHFTLMSIMHFPYLSLSTIMLQYSWIHRTATEYKQASGLLSRILLSCWGDYWAVIIKIHGCDVQIVFSVINAIWQGRNIQQNYFSIKGVLLKIELTIECAIKKGTDNPSMMWSEQNTCVNTLCVCCCCLDCCLPSPANVVLMNYNVVETLGNARSLITRLMSHLCSFAIVDGMCSLVLSLQIHPAWNR